MLMMWMSLDLYCVASASCLVVTSSIDSFQASLWKLRLSKSYVRTLLLCHVKTGANCSTSPKLHDAFGAEPTCESAAAVCDP